MMLTKKSLQEIAEDQLRQELREKKAREWLRSRGLDDWGNPITSPPLPSQETPPARKIPPLRVIGGFIRWFVWGQGRGLDILRGVIIAFIIIATSKLWVIYG